MRRLAALPWTLTVALSACASAGASASASATTTSPPSEAATASASPSAEASESAEPSDQASAEEVRIRLESSQFDPSELTIAAGTTVLFLNADSFTHTVTEGTNGVAVADPIVDRELAKSRTVRVTFDQPGTYEITCRIHHSMHLTVTVEG